MGILRKIPSGASSSGPYFLQPLIKGRSISLWWVPCPRRGPVTQFSGASEVERRRSACSSALPRAREGERDGSWERARLSGGSSASLGSHRLPPRDALLLRWPLWRPPRSRAACAGETSRAPQCNVGPSRYLSSPCPPAFISFSRVPVGTMRRAACRRHAAGGWRGPRSAALGCLSVRGASLQPGTRC